MPVCLTVYRGVSWKNVLVDGRSWNQSFHHWSSLERFQSRLGYPKCITIWKTRMLQPPQIFIEPCFVHIYVPQPVPTDSSLHNWCLRCHEDRYLPSIIATGGLLILKYTPLLVVALKYRYSIFGYPLVSFVYCPQIINRMINAREPIPSKSRLELSFEPILARGCGSYDEKR